MKYAILVFIAALCACSNGSSDSDENLVSQGIFTAQENVDVSDIEGLWVNSCAPNEQYENLYSRQFLDYLPGNISDSENTISFGYQYFIDSNCSQMPEPNTDLTDVVYIPYFDRDSINFNPVGIYTNSDGIVAKVVKFTSEFNGSTYLAYYLNEDILYLSFSNGSNYQFDYSDTYRVLQ
jgi:hypothetical protein